MSLILPANPLLRSNAARAPAGSAVIFVVAPVAYNVHTDIKAPKTLRKNSKPSGHKEFADSSPGPVLFVVACVDLCVQYSQRCAQRGRDESTQTRTEPSVDALKNAS